MPVIKRNLLIVRALWMLTFLLIPMCESVAADAPTAKSQQIERAASLPARTPWDLAALSRPPAFTWSSAHGVRSLTYEGEPYHGRKTRVFAYYATPGSLAGDASRDKDLPAMVLVHGGGGTAFPEWVRLWAKRGYAAIAMDLSGRRPEGTRLEDGGPDQDTRWDGGGPDATDAWVYHAVADVILAHSLVRSFPEVNAERTAVQGISWGGFLTCIVAGIDNRFKAAVTLYGCGYIYEKSSVFAGSFGRLSDEDRRQWIQRWEPSRYIGATTVPFLLVNGGTDRFYPPESSAKTYALVRSSKNIAFAPQMPHGHLFDKPKSIEIFIDAQLRDGPLLPLITNVVADAGHVEARVVSRSRLTTAKLHYSRDEIPIADNSKRKWMSLPAALKDGVLTAPAPPSGTMIWFLTVDDSRGASVSSELMFPGPKNSSP